MTDEPEGPPNEHTIDALRYMMARLHKPAPERLPPTILTPEFAQALCQERFATVSRKSGKTFSVKWSEEFTLTDEQMKVIGMDVGSASKGAIYVTTWTPEGLRYTEIPTADFYMPDPHGGNIGGNGSEDT